MISTKRNSHYNIYTVTRMIVIMFHLSMLTLYSEAWIMSSSSSSFSKHFVTHPQRSILSRNMVESVSVESLQDHPIVGEELAGSIQRWLDTEWMPQDIHIQIGESCKQSYLQCRQTGEHDLMTIMTTIVADLEAKWNEYDQDAFVGPWDITNYVSDFLTDKAGLERCSCSSQIY